MNAVARTQLTFQILTSLLKIFIPPEPVLKTWGSKCLALIAQIIKVFECQLYLKK